MTKRIAWVDQLRGFSIFLVVYGHNFPILEKYIYSFHMPLFLIASGFFFPDQPSINDVKSRFKSIIVPYFIWAVFLFSFWFLIGKEVGVSADKNLSVWKNFIGIFYAQGGMEYMDWSVPMWFLPMIFLAFVFYSGLNSISRNVVLLSILSIGLSVMGYLIDMNLPWSINVAMVSVLFIHFGKLLYQSIYKLSNTIIPVLIIFLLVLHYFLFDYNEMVSMHRSEYGNFILFLINSLTICSGIVLLFKYFPKFKFFEIFGKFSIVILALHLLALSFIKLLLILLFNRTIFEFTEIEKIIISVVQMIILVPSFYVINRYLPIVNGSFKRL